MKNTISLLLVLFTAGTITSALTKTDSLNRKDYQKILASLLRNDDKTFDLKTIKYVIPTTQEEAIIFYSFDDKEETSKSLRSLLKKIESLSINENREIFIKYLYLSEFVDGYFAEDYFDSIEKIALKKRTYFCKILTSVDKRKTKRLNIIKAHYCH
jgi:hypothetical protein